MADELWAAHDQRKSATAPYESSRHGKFNSCYLLRAFIRASLRGQALQALMDEHWYRYLEQLVINIILQGRDYLTSNAAQGKGAPEGLAGLNAYLLEHAIIPGFGIYKAALLEKSAMKDGLKLALHSSLSYKDEPTVHALGVFDGASGELCGLKLFAGVKDKAQSFYHLVQACATLPCAKPKLVGDSQYCTTHHLSLCYATGLNFVFNSDATRNGHLKALIHRYSECLYLGYDSGSTLLDVPLSTNDEQQLFNIKTITTHWAWVNPSRGQRERAPLYVHFIFSRKQYVRLEEHYLMLCYQINKVLKANPQLNQATLATCPQLKDEERAFLAQGLMHFNPTVGQFELNMEEVWREVRLRATHVLLSNCISDAEQAEQAYRAAVGINGDSAEVAKTLAPKAHFALSTLALALSTEFHQKLSTALKFNYLSLPAILHKLDSKRGFAVWQVDEIFKAVGVKRLIYIAD